MTAIKLVPVLFHWINGSNWSLLRFDFNVCLVEWKWHHVNSCDRKSSISGPFSGLEYTCLFRLEIELAIKKNMLIWTWFSINLNLKVEESGQFFNYIFLDGTQLMRRPNTTPKVWTGIQANSGLNTAATGSYRNLQFNSKLFLVKKKILLRLGTLWTSSMSKQWCLHSR